MSTAPARLVEKALCEILALAVPGTVDKPTVFVPQKGNDQPAPPTDGSPTPPPPDLEMPYNVVAVLDDGTSEVFPKSGVYQMRAAVVMLSNMDDTSVQEHEALARQVQDALDNLIVPQGWYDEADPENSFVTITGLDTDGPPVDVSDDAGQANCDRILMSIAANTKPLNRSIADSGQSFAPMPNVFAAPFIFAGDLLQGQVFGYFVLPATAKFLGVSLAIQAADAAAGFSLEFIGSDGQPLRSDCTIDVPAGANTANKEFSTAINLPGATVIQAKVSSYVPPADPSAPASYLTLQMSFQSSPS